MNQKVKLQTDEFDWIKTASEKTFSRKNFENLYFDGKTTIRQYAERGGLQPLLRNGVEVRNLQVSLTGIGL